MMPAANRPDRHLRGSEVSADRGALIPVEQKVAALRRPESYPAWSAQVDVVETHMAWVFLTDEHAWKMKKPVRSDFLDFSTLEARRRDCEEEIRLNRRLAPDVYLGLVPLTADSVGRLRLDGPGEPVEWLVQMRRLPACRMLDRAVADGTVRESDVRGVGRLLAEFYRQAPPADWTADEYRCRLAESIDQTRRELEQPVYRCPIDLVESLAEAQLELLECEPELFDRRIEHGRIVEAHGDLRPEHICLEERPVVIDCLEFNRELRLLDAASELAFLALECRRLGAAWVGEQIFDGYCETTGDRPPGRLIAFYTSWHALTRAKIAVWHLKDDDVQTPDKWPARARLYLNLGRESQSALHRGM
jgi:uncharacterized protein